jgi:hypothetical protein
VAADCVRLAFCPTLAPPLHHHGHRIATRSIASLYWLIITMLSHHDVVSHQIVVYGSLPVLTGSGEPLGSFIAQCGWSYTKLNTGIRDDPF